MSDFQLIKAQATELAGSGFWRDASKSAQAIAKVMAGAELGIPPVMAMSQVQIIQGRPTLGAGAIAGLVKGSGKYRYQQRQHTDRVCELEFFERVDNQWVSVGTSSFSMDDAKRAGLAGGHNWKKYPRNMLFARAISNGARWYCPDVFHGSIYTPEELGGGYVSVEDDDRRPPAEVIDVTPAPEPTPSPSPERARELFADKLVQGALERGVFKTAKEARGAYEKTLAELRETHDKINAQLIREEWEGRCERFLRSYWTRRLHAELKKSGEEWETVKARWLESFNDQAGTDITSTTEMPVDDFVQYARTEVAGLEGARVSAAS